MRISSKIHYVGIMKDKAKNIFYFYLSIPLIGFDSKGTYP